MVIETEVVQVVVVGAGPVGLMLAAELRLGGVDVLVVDQRASGTVGESRAVGVNARSLEILTQRGLGEQCKQAGSPMSMVLFGGMFMDPKALEPGWPDALRLPQHHTERILAERAGELGAMLRWSTSLDDLEQDEAGVVVHLSTPTGPGRVRAQYVVGCDGGRSKVRTCSDIAFPGVRGEDWWVVGDVDLADPPQEHGVFGRNERVGFYQVSRAESDYFRLTLMCRTPPADPTSPVTLDEVRAAMVDGLGSDYGLRGARWLSRWSDGFHHAATYRKDRVFLAGDAAHTHPPIGGQGLNVGLQDAVNLGWKLAAVVRGEAPDELLDTYHAERHPVEADATRWSLSQTELVKPGPRRDATREVFADLLDIPEVCLRLSGHLSGLDLRYPLGEDHPLLGRRLPNWMLTTAAGSTDVFTQLHTGQPLLLDLGVGNLTDGVAGRLTDTVSPWADRLRHVTARYDPDERSDRWHLPVFGDVPAVDAVLVRPDGYVAWVNPADQPVATSTLTQALTRWLGAL